MISNITLLPINQRLKGIFGAYASQLLAVLSEVLCQAWSQVGILGSCLRSQIHSMKIEHFLWDRLTFWSMNQTWNIYQDSLFHLLLQAVVFGIYVFLQCTHALRLSLLSAMLTKHLLKCENKLIFYSRVLGQGCWLEKTDHSQVNSFTHHQKISLTTHVVTAINTMPVQS